MLQGYVLGGTNGHLAPVSCMDLYNPGSLATSVHEANLVSADLDRTILLWNPSEIRNPVGNLQGSHSVCQKLQFSKTDPFKIYAACHKDILIWDVRNSQQPLHMWKTGIENISSFDLSESDNSLAISNHSTNIFIISTKDGSLIYSKNTLHTEYLTDIKFRQNRKWNQIISGSLDGTILFTDWSQNGKAKAILELSDYQDIDELIDSDDDDSSDTSSNSLAHIMRNSPQVRCLASDETGRYLVAGLHNGSLMTFNIELKNPAQIETVNCHTGDINCVTFAHDSHILSGGQDCMLTCVRLEPNGYQQRIINDRPVRQIQAKNLSKVFVIDSTRHIYMFDIAHM